MSESQSRYSIVERLTNKKLSIMDEINKLEKHIEDKKQEIESSEREFKSWEVNILEEVKQAKVEKENRLVNLRAELKFLSENKEKEETALKLKITELNTAMDAITEISRTA